MCRLIRIELIKRQLILSLQYAKLFRRHIAKQAAFLRTDRTGAARELRQIRIDLKFNSAAVTRSVVGLHLILRQYQQWILSRISF